MPMGWSALAAAVIGGGASYAGSQKANKTQQKAIDEQRRQFELMRGDQSGYKDIGKSALNRLSDLYGLDRAFDGSAPTRDQFTKVVGSYNKGKKSLLGNFDPLGAALVKEGSLPDKAGLLYKKENGNIYGFDQTGFDTATAKYNQDLEAFNHRDRGMAAFQKDPGYEFRLNQGIQNFDRSANARGIGMSGGALKELDRYNQDYASNEFTNYANRLSALAGIGQTATNTSAQLGQANANTLSGLYQGMGNNYMSSYAGMNNAIQGGLGNYAFMNYLNKKPTGTAPSGAPSNMTGGYYEGMYNPDLLNQQYAQGWGYGD